MTKTLLFLNGQPPEQLPSLEDYNIIACTDGAFHYLKRKGFPLDQLTFISGDFDSHSGKDQEVYAEKFIHTPDQDKTDFQKALEILVEKGVTDVDIYGGSGGEMDHYLGNLTVAYQFKDKMNLVFYDEYSRYFFIPKNFTQQSVKGKMISLFPFPFAKNVTTLGLNWPLFGENLDITNRIGTRNFAKEDTFTCTFDDGGMLVFIGK